MRSKLIRFVILIGAVHFFIPNGLCHQDEAFGQRVSSSSDTLRVSAPKFPQLTDTTKASADSEIRSDPDISINLGVAFGSYDVGKVGESYPAIERAYGATSSGQFTHSPLDFSVGLRLHCSKDVAIWCEYFHGGKSGNKEVSTSVISLSLMYMPIVTEKISVSVGAGSAWTNVYAERSYNHPIPNSDGTLNSIKLEAIGKNGIPLTILLEFHGSKLSRHLLYLTAKYIMASDYERSVTLNIPGGPANVSVPIRVEMRSLWVGLGLAIGF